MRHVEEMEVGEKTDTECCIQLQSIKFVHTSRTRFQLRVWQTIFRHYLTTDSCLQRLSKKLEKYSTLYNTFILQYSARIYILCIYRIARPLIHPETTVKLPPAERDVQRERKQQALRIIQQEQCTSTPTNEAATYILQRRPQRGMISLQRTNLSAPNPTSSFGNSFKPQDQIRFLPESRTHHTLMLCSVSDATCLTV